MKLLLIIFLFVSNISYSQDEDKLVVSTVKEKEIETALSKNPDLQDCKKMKDAEQDSCISKLINSMDDKQLEAVAKDLGSSAYEVDGGAKAESIKKFMQERIEKIIYGDKKPDDKNKKAAVVGHNTYREIYKSQLGKNMFLDINSYCLENLGYEENPMKVISAVILSESKESVEGIVFTDYTNEKEPDPGKPISMTSFWKNVAEYSRGKKDTEGKRSVEQIGILKKKSLELYKTQPVLAKTINAFCRDTVIKGMCTIYKCNNQFSSMEETEKNECKDFDINSGNVSNLDTNTKKKGQIACGLIKRLESYKMTLEGIKEQEDYFKEEQENYGFNNVVETIDTEYSDIDKMTSISSRELVNETEAIKNSEEDAKVLEEECKDGNTDEKCTKTLSGLSESDEDGINLETKIANEVYKQRLKKLGANGDPEEFKKFLEDNNLLDKYGKQLDSLTPAQLATIISNDYTSKKNALKDEMIAKYRATKKTNIDGTEEVDSQAALKEKVDELKEEKSYIETMFEYNNIVTSYLDLTLEKQENGRTVKESAGSFDQNRKNELEAIKKYAKDDKEAMEDYENYQQMFNDKESNQSDSGKTADDIDFLSFIDGVLGVQ